MLREPYGRMSHQETKSMPQQTYYTIHTLTFTGYHTELKNTRKIIKYCLPWALNILFRVLSLNTSLFVAFILFVSCSSFVLTFLTRLTLVSGICLRVLYFGFVVFSVIGTVNYWILVVVIGRICNTYLIALLSKSNRFCFVRGTFIYCHLQSILLSSADNSYLRILIHK